METEINYDKLIEKSLKNVVKEALMFAQNQFLDGNHFYITFKTNIDGVEMPKSLKEQYPDAMTIVLQHQFSNLCVNEKAFSVDLSFGGIPVSLCVPFDAITYFADPYAKFGLSFSDTEPAKKQEKAEEKEPEMAPVISIAKFRKK